MFKFNVSAKEESNFQKKHILKLKDEYLNTNTINKYKEDKGYRDKIDQIKSFLDKYKTSGYILDIGSNTSGESEILYHFGHNMVASDINEIALSISKKRSLFHRDEKLNYIAMDAHNIPFIDNTFDKIIAYEMLHHMEKIKISLDEMFRVMKPGGFFFTVEPYALNPYRRITEIRDYFRGTIEKSFTISKLKKLFLSSGFIIQEIKMVPFVYPETKIKNSSWLRGKLKKFYSIVSSNLTSVFGMIYLVAKKPGNIDTNSFKLFDNLKCPITSEKLFYDDNYYYNLSKTKKYKCYDDIPVIIKDEVIEI